MKHYCKSILQYKKERQRRKAAYELAVQGFNYEQIAEKFGVSTKTIQRDFKKLRPYLERKLRHSINQFSDEMHRKLEASMAGMTDIQRFDYLTKLILARDKERQYNRHNFKLLINLDDLINGVFPKITFIPKPPFTLTRKPGEYNYMHFGYVKDGKEYLVGHLKTG